MKTRIYYSDSCPTCNRPSGSPFRTRDERGDVTSGCVDHFHTDRLVAPSASATWHGRTEAKKIRAAMKARRNGGVTVPSPNC